MSFRTIYILCQGEQTRLVDLGKHKHLLEVNGEPILRRTLRLLRELGEPHPVVVGRYPLLYEAMLDAEKRGACEDKFDIELGVTRHRVYHRLATLDDPGTCVLDGIAGILRPDAVDTIVLLGDVVWSKPALAWMLDNPASGVQLNRLMWFSGTSILSPSQGEVFAVGWLASERDRVRALLETVPCRTRADGGPMRFSQQQGGHLRRLLWWAMASADYIPLSETRMWCSSIYLNIEDWTTDIDDQADVDRLPELDALCAAEGS